MGEAEGYGHLNVRSQQPSLVPWGQLCLGREDLHLFDPQSKSLKQNEAQVKNIHSQTENKVNVRSRDVRLPREPGEICANVSLDIFAASGSILHLRKMHLRRLKCLKCRGKARNKTQSCTKPWSQGMHAFG